MYRHDHQTKGAHQNDGKKAMLRHGYTFCLFNILITDFIPIALLYES
jgi:hypothetical protein